MLRDSTSVWRHRDLRIALPARALSSFGDNVALVAITLRLFEEGHGPWAVSALFVCAAAPVVALARPAGRLVDAVPFRTLAAPTAALQAVCCVALAADGPVWMLLVLVLALQIGSTVAEPAWQAILPSIVGEQEIGRVVATSQVLTMSAIVAAPAVAGVAVASSGYTLPLLVDGATFAVLALAALAVRATRGATDAPDVSDTAAERAFVLRSDALLWPLVAGLCALVVAGELTNVVEVFLVRGVLGAGPTAYGALLAVFAAGMVAGALLTRADRPDATRAVRASVAALVLSFGLLVAGAAPTLVVFAAAWAMAGVANGVVNADAATLVLRRAPERSRGRTIARLNAMTRASGLAAMALGGAAASMLGPRVTFVVSGAVCVVVASVVVALVRRAATDRRVPCSRAAAGATGRP